MRDDRERLLDIQEAIVRIERYAELGRDAFEQDELIQNWMISHLQIIGEACRALSEDVRGRYPEVPWRAIMGMRNILVHQYFAIDANAVWVALERDLPNLRRVITTMLEALSSEE